VQTLALFFKLSGMHPAERFHQLRNIFLRSASAHLKGYFEYVHPVYRSARNARRQLSSKLLPLPNRLLGLNGCSL